MRQLMKKEFASTLQQRGFVLINTDGRFALMRTAYGVMIKAINDLHRKMNSKPADTKKKVTSSWKQGCTVTVCSKEVISPSRNRIPERKHHKRTEQKYNPNNRKEHRDRTRIVEVLADA